MANILTRDAWNGLITDINALAVAPPAGCSALDTLPLVDENHIFTRDDIFDARNKLSQMCFGAFVTSPLVFWLQNHITEIETAIAEGWCNCEFTGCDNIYAGISSLCYFQTLPRANLPLGICTNPANESGSQAFAEVRYWVARWEEVVQVTRVEFADGDGNPTGVFGTLPGDVGFVDDGSDTRDKDLFTPNEGQARLAFDVVTRALDSPCAVVGMPWVWPSPAPEIVLENTAFIPMIDQAYFRSAPNCDLPNPFPFSIFDTVGC